ncbi:unnamed protein product, partial [Closterium sp. NIES-54]
CGGGGRGGGGGSSGSGGVGGGGSGGGGAGRGTATQRGGLGGGQRQQQLRTRETPSVQQLREWYAGRGRSGGAGPCTYVLRTEFDAILAAMYAHADIIEGDGYLRVPPDPGTVAAALGASASAAPGTWAAAALGASASAAPGAGTSPPSGTPPTASFHTFTLDSGASRSLFSDSTTLTPLSRPVAVSLADPSGGPVLAHSSTVLPCHAAPSGLLSGLHLPSFSTKLRVTHCTCSRTGRHLATFTRRPGSSLYTLTTAPPPVAAYSQVFPAASRSSPGLPPPFLSPPPVQSQSQLQPASPLPGPSPYSGPTRGLTERREPESRPVTPESRPASPVRPVRAGRVLRQRLPPVPGTHSMTLRPSTAPQRVPLPSPPASSLPDGPDPESDSLRAASPSVTRFLAIAVTDPLFESSAASALVAELVDFAAACRLDYAASLVAEYVSASVCPPSVGGECVLGTDVLEDRDEDLECFSAASPHLVSMLLAPEGDPDALDIPTPRSYAEAIEGPYSSPWQGAMDAEMASWKSTGTYVDEVPPPGANI